MKRELSITSGPLTGVFVDLYIYGVDSAMVRVNCDNFQLRGIYYSSIAVDLNKKDGKWEARERYISRKLQDGKDLTYEQKERMCGYVLESVRHCLDNPADIKQARIESLTAEIEKQQGIIADNLGRVSKARIAGAVAQKELSELIGNETKTYHRCKGRFSKERYLDTQCEVLTTNPNNLCMIHTEVRIEA